MIRTLLALRFRAFLASLAGTLNRSRVKRKKVAGSWILLCILGIYVLGASCAMMYLLFDSLAEPYHMMGLDWLYFGFAGTLALGIALLGSVFASQSQLYDAKDNALLLSMPIPPGKILMSRMLPLLAMNLSFCLLVILTYQAVH